MPPFTELIFDTPVRDEFRWLEEVNNPQVQAWMHEQDGTARSYLGSLPERPELKQRLTELVYVEQRTLPIQRGKRYFYSIKPKDKEKSLYYVREGKRGKERVLLDPNTMSADGSVSIGSQSPSHNGEFVAYLEHPKNADESTLRVLDVNSGRNLPDEIPHLRYTSASWLPDGSGFYYTWLPDPSVPVDERMARAEVRFHRLGTPASADPMVFPATLDPSRMVDGWVSKDGEMLFVQVGRGWSQNDLYARRTRDVTEPFTVMARDLPATFNVTKFKDTLYILTNEGAPRFRVFRTEAQHPERAAWQELIPEDPVAVLDDARIVGGHLVLTYLKDAHSEVQVRTLQGSLVRKVQLPGIGTASPLVGNDDSDEAYFSFSSFVYPQEIFETSVARGGAQLFARVSVPVDVKDFETHQTWFQSKDGTRVPMFVIHKKALVRDGKNPTLMTAYGGFAVSLLPEFNAALFAWLERGGVVAIPNLRGGGEFGESWHAAGMLHNKQNVFDDFAAAAEHLISEKYTSASHLGIVGRSNGGLLVGAAVTQRPELYGAVICGVPLLDMLRYHKFGLGKTWIPEYGNPEIREHFEWLARYSPYHHLREGVTYPPLLMTSADTDDRVDPMHARKFVAALDALAEATHRDRRTWLRIERNSGHGGSDLRRSYVERSADEYAFLLNALR
jgi:prolyl oligopeptidase